MFIRRSQNSGAPSMASSLCHVLLLLSLFFNPISVLPVCALNSEGLALLSFKSSIQSDPQASLANWNPAQPNPCSWNGITCNPSSSVVSISLPKSNLLGSLPISLSSLPSLRHINLRTNRLSGPLSPSLFLPLSALQSLVLSGNSFSGSIPNSVTHCHKLRALDLSRNNFSGSLPADFATSLVSLQRLDLSHNRLDGSIPADVGNLSSLQDTADFSHNLFSGSIPASLGDLPDKVYIDLTYNNLSGPIPQIGALANRGPTAFIGNPGLCGPPLRNPCSPLNLTSAGPFLPSDSPPQVSEVSDGSGHGSTGRRSLSRTVVAAIVASDAVGVGLIALVFYCCYRRATASKGGEDSSGKSDKVTTVRRECMCFRKDESETVSENVEQYDLVALDRHLGFNLDELLKASAFVLGKSEIGIVYKVVLEDGITLAVRRLGEGGSQRFREFRTEVEAIGRVRHANIVALRAYYWSIDEKLLIYDYIPNGSLSSAIHGRAGSVTFSPLSWDQRYKIMRGISKGLAFLHEFSPKKYVHGDLKPSNVLLGSNMEPFISDFGLGRLANIAGGSPLIRSYRLPPENPQKQQSDTPVSPIISNGSCYQAPEALKMLKPSQKWDVYSYGVILLELISGRSPALLLETSEMDLVHWVQYCIEEKKPLLDLLDPSLANDLDREDMFIAVLKIALTCVQSNPERRPLMRHIADALDRFVTKR